MITEEEVKKIIWKSISIMKMENENILVFLYPTSEESKTALDIIRKRGQFKLRLLMDSKNRYVLQMEFDGEDAIRYETGKTAETYPPLKWLQNGLVKLFSTGFKDEQMAVCRNSIHPLDSSWNLN